MPLIQVSNEPAWNCYFDPIEVMERQAKTLPPDTSWTLLTSEGVAVMGYVANEPRHRAEFMIPACWQWREAA